MTKRGIENWMEKTDEQLAAEDAGREVLQKYCAERGVQARICRRTNILPSALCRLIKGENQIHLEAALLIEMATDGEVRAEVLCPSRAPLLQAVMRQRSAQVGG